MAKFIFIFLLSSLLTIFIIYKNYDKLKGSLVPEKFDYKQQKIDLKGQVALVTGSTNGLGRELALELANLGATVIIHGRNQERGESVVRQIQEKGRGDAVFYPADFASLDEVRAFASKIREQHSRLDILINNAGIWRKAGDNERYKSVDGHELLFAVNYLATYLLTIELKDLLKSSAPSRVVNVASGAQRAIDFNDINMDSNFSPDRAYAQSKLAQVIFTFDRASEFAKDGISLNCLHPASLMDTNMVQQAGIRPQSTVNEGVNAVLNLALSPKYSKRYGHYLNGLQEERAHPQAYDKAVQAQLRKLSERLTAKN